MNQGKNDDVVAEKLAVEQRAVALDIAGLLQGADASQAGWRRNTHPPRQIEIGDSAIVLQLLQDAPVDSIQPSNQVQLQYVSVHLLARPPGSYETLLRQLATLFPIQTRKASTEQICGFCSAPLA